MNKVIHLQKYLFVSLGVFIPISIAITNFIIVLLAICWALEGDLKSKIKIIKDSKWMLSIFALIGLYALGMFWGDIHLNAKWQFQRLALLLVFPILATIKINQRTIENGVAAFLITNFISAVIAILINNQIISPLGEIIPLINNSPKVSAFIKYNYHNVLLALSVMLCGYLVIENKTRHKYLLLIFIIAYTVSIFTEKGRAGQVIFNLAAIFYIIYYNSRNLFRGIAFFLLLFSFQFVVYNTTKAYKSRLDSVSHIIKNNGIREDGGYIREDIRYVFVRESLTKIFEKPFLGHGTGSFGAIFKDDIDSGHVFNKHTTPHNQYLYIWFELGILGLLLLLRIFYYQTLDLFKKSDGVHKVLLPLSFMFLMLIDSYFFIFIVTIAYIYLYTIYNRYQLE